ncbi:MAG: hypothetical protein OWS74_03310, partial [Firmicutes bacterium]|nr:hypothetical protein [Bacillota bacterium]
MDAKQTHHVLSFVDARRMRRFLEEQDPGPFRLSHYDELPQGEERQRILQEVDVILSSNIAIEQSLLDQMPRVQMVQTIGSGYNQVDVGECLRRGIVVAHNPGHNAAAVAEYALMAALYLLHRMGEA